MGPLNLSVPLARAVCNHFSQGAHSQMQDEDAAHYGQVSEKHLCWQPSLERRCIASGDAALLHALGAYVIEDPGDIPGPEPELTLVAGQPCGVG